MNTAPKIARLQLVHRPLRTAAAAAGIAFSAVLMLVQTGLHTAVFAGVTRLYAHLRADLVLISPQYQSQLATESFPRRRLAQLLGVPGVRSVDAVYIGQVPWKNPSTHRERAISILGLPERIGLVDLPGVDPAILSLRAAGTVLFDQRSRPEFGPISDLLGANGVVQTEMRYQRASVTGLFDLGASFAVDGTILAGYETFFRTLPERRADQVDLGLINLDAGVDARSVRDRIVRMLPPDVWVLTQGDLVRQEENYWENSLPIGYVLGMNVVLGMVVGIVIVYQILYTDITDHLSEYATLKAIGFSDRKLNAIVLCQAFLLSVLGYIPGFLLSMLIYSVTRNRTFLVMEMMPVRALEVYGLVLIMCTSSGLLAARMLKRADPAEMI